MNKDLLKFDKLLISARYWLLGMAENDPEYFKVIDALELGLEHHDGYRNGGDPEFVHQLGIFHYLRTMHKHISNPKTVYKLVFLHDALEDPNQKSKRDGAPKYITPEEIRDTFGEPFLVKLRKMSKEILGLPNLDFSLDAVFDDEDTSVAKGGDRVDNVASMIGVFKRARLERYVKETMEEFLPRLKRSRRKFASQEAIYENIKMELVGTITLIGHILDGYVPHEA
jgi:(p)ppGpp synthase/HD superfamily hydrolase